MDGTVTIEFEVIHSTSWTHLNPIVSFKQGLQSRILAEYSPISLRDAQQSGGKFCSPCPLKLVARPGGAAPVGLRRSRSWAVCAHADGRRVGLLLLRARPAGCGLRHVRLAASCARRVWPENTLIGNKIRSLVLGTLGTHRRTCRNHRRRQFE